MHLPQHDVVVVGYLGQLDVLLIRPFTWLRDVPLVWDTFLSLYDTVVDLKRECLVIVEPDDVGKMFRQSVVLHRFQQRVMLVGGEHGLRNALCG